MAVLYSVCSGSGCAMMTVRTYFTDPDKLRPVSRARIEQALAQLEHGERSAPLAPTNTHHSMAITSLGNWGAGKGPR